jgi:hypothetical protein
MSYQEPLRGLIEGAHRDFTESCERLLKAIDLIEIPADLTRGALPERCACGQELVYVVHRDEAEYQAIHILHGLYRLLPASHTLDAAAVEAFLSRWHAAMPHRALLVRPIPDRPHPSDYAGRCDACTRVILAVEDGINLWELAGSDEAGPHFALCRDCALRFRDGITAAFAPPSAP